MSMYVLWIYAWFSGRAPAYMRRWRHFCVMGIRGVPWFTGGVDADADEGRWRYQPAKDVLGYLGLTYRDGGGAGAGFGFYARGECAC